MQRVRQGYINGINVIISVATGVIDYAFSGLTVALTPACLRVRDRGGLERMFSSAPGDVVWHEGPAALEITNVGPEPYRAVLCEWR